MNHPYQDHFLEYAKREMNVIHDGLIHYFVTIVRHLIDTQVIPISPVASESEAHIRKLALSFANARKLCVPSMPKTKPDPLVSVILNEYNDIAYEDLGRASQEHGYSMAAENFVGGLLERYLASVLETRGWVWCAGSTVRAVDFIKFEDGHWHKLQVKNRDNSENSSSSAIRNGTDIQKWFRLRSRSGQTNWHAFPDRRVADELSEDNFQTYVRNHMRHLRTM